MNDAQYPSGYNTMFCSSSIPANRFRYAIDDLESLVYSIWYVAGVPMDKSLINNSFEPEGFIMYQSEKRGEVREKMKVSSKKQNDLVIMRL